MVSICQKVVPKFKRIPVFSVDVTKNYTDEKVRKTKTQKIDSTDSKKKKIKVKKKPEKKIIPI